jgi:hypothetical protein
MTNNTDSSKGGRLGASEKPKLGLKPVASTSLSQVQSKREPILEVNSWDSVAKLLKLVDEVDTHIITLMDKTGRKYWVHREDNDE